MLATPEQRADAFRRSIRANVTYWRTAPETAVQNTRVADHVWQNVIRAILFACEERSAWVEAARLAIGLFDVMQHRGAWHEWGNVLANLANALVDEPRLRGRILIQRGQCLLMAAQYQDALSVLEQAEKLVLQVGDAELIIRSRTTLSEAHRFLRQYTAAERIGMLVLENLGTMPESAEKTLIHVAVRSTLGQVCGGQGRLAEAEEHLRRALALVDAPKYGIEACRLCCNLANVLAAGGRVAEALACLDQALTYLPATMQYTFDRANVELSRGSYYFQLGDLVQAVAAFRRIDTSELRRGGHWLQAAHTANNLGNVYQQQGRLPEAETALTDALVLMRDLEDDVELANILLTLGEVVEAQGRRTEAEPLWREAVERAEKHPTDTRAQRYVAKGRKYLAG